MIRYLLLSILILLVARAFWRVMDGVIEAAGGRSRTPRSPARSVKLVRDPVCGTYVNPASAVPLVRVGTAQPYFCSERCRDEFVGRTDRQARSHVS